MTDGNPGLSRAATTPLRRNGRSADPAKSTEYSARLAALAAVHRAAQSAGDRGVAVGRGRCWRCCFPQLETVVRQQSVDLIPRDVASFQTVDRMSAAFGEQGAKTMLFVAMEDPAGLTPSARERYEQLVTRLRADTEHVLLVQDLLADPVTEAQAVSPDRKAWYLPVGVAGTLGDPTAAESVKPCATSPPRYSPARRPRRM